MALALARPMARMQVEVERQIQMHRRSPVADLVSRRIKELVRVRVHVERLISHYTKTPKHTKDRKAPQHKHALR